MDKSTRVRLIQQVRDALYEQKVADIALLLDEFGFGGFDGVSSEAQLTVWLQGGSDDDLLALGQHLAVPLAADAAEGVPDPTSSDTGGEPGRLLLFGSHLSTERAFVGQVETALALFGVTLFVAHDSIPVDAEWQPEIAEALRRCDAGVVFLHEGIHGRYYCMQEVGWLLGRAVPIARLMFDEAPLGLIGDRQGIQARGDADQVAAAILDYVAGKPELQSQFATSLVHAMKDSQSYARSNEIWDLLLRVGDLTPGQCETLAEAAEENPQVYAAGVGGWSGPRFRGPIADFLDGQAGAASLAARIARLRTHKDSPHSMQMLNILDEED